MSEGPSLSTEWRGIEGEDSKGRQDRRQEGWNGWALPHGCPLIDFSRPEIPSSRDRPLIQPNLPDVLREIHVRNLAVLAEAAVELGAGFNVLSGETGAGKSIVVDSLSLLAGARASAEMVRTGAEALTVSGVFEPEGDGWRSVLEEAGLEAEGDEVLVRREIGRSGRNRVFVNDQPTTLRLLADLAPYLLRIHGQRDELGPDRARPPARHARPQRRRGSRSRCSPGWRRPSSSTAPGRAAGAPLGGRPHAPRADRPPALPGRRDRRRQAARRRGGGAARRSGTSCATPRRSPARSAPPSPCSSKRRARRWSGSARPARCSPRWRPGSRTPRAWRAELEEARIRLTETGALAASTGWTAWRPIPARLDFVEERLAIIERLCRKHGGDSGAVLARRAEIAAELAELEGDDENRDELEGKVAAALAAYREGRWRSPRRARSGGGPWSSGSRGS